MDHAGLTTLRGIVARLHAVRDGAAAGSVLDRAPDRRKDAAVKTGTVWRSRGRPLPPDLPDALIPHWAAATTRRLMGARRRHGVVTCINPHPAARSPGLATTFASPKEARTLPARGEKPK